MVYFCHCTTFKTSHVKRNRLHFDDHSDRHAHAVGQVAVSQDCALLECGRRRSYHAHGTQEALEAEVAEHGPQLETDVGEGETLVLSRLFDDGDHLAACPGGRQVRGPVAGMRAAAVAVPQVLGQRLHFDHSIGPERCECDTILRMTSGGRSGAPLSVGSPFSTENTRCITASWRRSSRPLGTCGRQRGGGRCPESAASLTLSRRKPWRTCCPSG